VAVHVRVKLARQTPEGALDVGLGGAALDTEQLVGVGLGHPVQRSYTDSKNRDSSPAASRTEAIAVA
jgi:hypothetical protein